MAQQNLQQLFAAKYFVIPSYQRSYSWDKINVRELYDDLIEAVETSSSHYIGTIVLAKTDLINRYFVVDGQQRLTTIIMFLSVIISKLKNVGERDYWARYYVRSPNNYKIEPLVRDSEFFHALLNGSADLKPRSKSQRCLLDAYEEMCSLVKLSRLNSESLINAFGSLQILEFIEDNETDAIRIFQTVNDRGKELSRMDKMKSLLFYFSSRYCDCTYNLDINESFGEIFELYDQIKSAGEEERINNINSKQFTEDEILRHHHICFSQESYNPSGQWVLDNVKEKLLSFRRLNNFNEMGLYIEKYLKSLLEYSRAFSSVVSLATEQVSYYKLFVIQAVSASLYPIIVVLFKNRLLDRSLEKKNINFVELIAIIDVRVMKVRSYEGRKEIAQMCFDFNDKIKNLEDTEALLSTFNSSKISNDKFRDDIANYDYSAQSGLLRALFIDYCERLQGKRYDLMQLRKIMQGDPTIEHVLSQTPAFRAKSFGFRDAEHFEEWQNMIGNLTLLEKKINSAVGNLDLSEKIDGYAKSKFRMTAELGAALGIDLKFRQADLELRNRMLAADFADRWSA